MFGKWNTQGFLIMLEEVIAESDCYILAKVQRMFELQYSRIPAAKGKKLLSAQVKELAKTKIEARTVTAFFASFT